MAGPSTESCGMGDGQAALIQPSPVRRAEAIYERAFPVEAGLLPDDDLPRCRGCFRLVPAETRGSTSSAQLRKPTSLKFGSA